MTCKTDFRKIMEGWLPRHPLFPTTTPHHPALIALSIFLSFFFVFPAPAITISNLPAASISSTSAVLSATLDDIGSTNPTVVCYYGSAPGGTNSALWASSNILGALPAGTAEVTVSNLLPAAWYYFTFHASDPSNSVWASPPLTLSTTPRPPDSYPAASSGRTVMADSIGNLLSPTGFFGANAEAISAALAALGLSQDDLLVSRLSVGPTNMARPQALNMFDDTEVYISQSIIGSENQAQASAYPAAGIELPGTNLHWYSGEHGITNMLFGGGFNEAWSESLETGENSKTVRLSDFDFTIPDNAVILGAVLNIYSREQSGSYIYAALSSANQTSEWAYMISDGDLDFPRTNTIGAADDTWGLTGLTGADINAGLQADIYINWLQYGGGILNWRIDAIEITIYYSTATTDWKSGVNSSGEYILEHNTSGSNIFTATPSGLTINVPLIADASNLSNIPPPAAIAFESITNPPTTLSGYGITDAVPTDDPDYLTIISSMTNFVAVASSSNYLAYDPNTRTLTGCITNLGAGGGGEGVNTNTAYVFASNLYAVGWGQKVQDLGLKSDSFTADPNLGTYIKFMYSNAVWTCTVAALPAGYAVPVTFELTRSTALDGTNTTIYWKDAVYFPGGWTTNFSLSTTTGAVDVIQMLWNGSRYNVVNAAWDIK